MALRDMYYFSGMQGNVNPYFLPKHHLNILMACDKLTRILCKMTRLHYVSAGAKEPTAIAADIESVKEWRAKDFAALEELEAA